FGIHAEFDNLQRDIPLDWLTLFSQPHGAEPTFTELFEQSVAANRPFAFVSELTRIFLAGAAVVDHHAFPFVLTPEPREVPDGAAEFRKALSVRVHVDALALLAAQVPFSQQQLSQEFVLLC